MNTSELRRLEVIDADTAERLGYVRDMDIDFETGRIRSVIVPKKLLFFTRREYVIPWENIVAVGKEVILARPEKDGSTE